MRRRGSVWISDEAKRLAEEWEPHEPPEGEGWQLWETVSEGSPVSPVFATAEELPAWLAGPEGTERRGVNSEMTEEQWLRFLKGWAPSMVVAGGKVMSGIASA